MKNTNIELYKIIKNSLIVCLLFYLLFKISGYTKFMIIPFIMCGIFSIGKNIGIMKKNKKLINLFNKLFIVSFLIFWFGILIFASYLCFKSKQNPTFILTIPFWIVGIFLTRKYLFENNKIKKEKKKYLNIDIKVIISSLLVGSVLIIGIICFTIGVKDTYKLNKRAKDYIETIGYFTDYTIFSKDEDGITYKLFYTYQVDGIDYIISTDYGTGYIPKLGSTKEIKYNPENYEEAILVGTNSNNGLIYFGLFFILGATAFILFALQIKGTFDKVKFDVIGAYFGIVFILIGMGIILFQIGITSSLVETLKSFRLWMIIPILLILVGAFQTFKSLFGMNKNKKRK